MESIWKNGFCTAHFLVSSALTLRVRPSSPKPHQWATLENKLKREVHMNTILVVVLIVLLIGALPTWPYSANWGYYPSGGLGLVVVILLVLLLTGRLS